MPISDSQADGLIRLVRSTLTNLPGREVVDKRQPSEPSAVLVSVAVYVGQRLQASMSGRGHTLEDAVREAAVRAAAYVRFGALQPGDLRDSRVELWVQTMSEVIDSANIVKDVDLGFHGVEMSAHGHWACYTPSVALTSGLSRQDLLFDMLTKKADLPPGSWRDPHTTLKRTEWEHYCESPTHPRRVLHLRRLRSTRLEEATSASLQTRACLAADRLMRVQSSEGYFLYKFHPLTNRETPGPGNLVRQAGCAYALARAADSAPEPQRRAALASSASRVIDALLSRVLTRAGSWFIVHVPKAGAPIRGNLGVLALTLAAIQSPSLGSRYEAERQRIAEAILSWQRPDGSFRCRFNSICLADDGASQDYFPGEALTAVVLEMRSGGQHAQRAMAAALRWYRSRFRKQPTTAFVPWQIEAWRLFAEWAMSVASPVVPDAKASSEFVFEMADWMLRHQIGPAGVHPDLIGGFALADSKPGVSTASYTQAIIGALSLAMKLGDGDRASRYREASLAGLDYVRRLQIVPETAVLFSDPARAVGGTTGSLSDMTIRCDYDQHALTAYLAALETTGLLEN